MGVTNARQGWYRRAKLPIVNFLISPEILAMQAMLEFTMGSMILVMALSMLSISLRVIMEVFQRSTPKTLVPTGSEMDLTLHPCPPVGITGVGRSTSRNPDSYSQKL